MMNDRPPSSSFSSSRQQPPPTKVPHIDKRKCEYCGVSLQNVINCDPPPEIGLSEYQILSHLPEKADKVIITDYQLFDFNGHLRSLSDILFESVDEGLYLSGKAKLKSLRPTATLGPIIGWELEVAEDKDFPVPVLLTEECAYHLGVPNKPYEPFAKRVERGIEIGCAVVDFIEAGNRGAEYEDMIFYLTTRKGITVEELFSEYFAIFKYLFLYDTKKKTPGYIMQTRALKTFAKLTGFDQYIPQHLLPEGYKLSMRTKRSFPIQKREFNIKYTEPPQNPTFSNFEEINQIFGRKRKDVLSDIPDLPKCESISLLEESKYHRNGERAYNKAVIKTPNGKTLIIQPGCYAIANKAIYRVLYMYMDGNGRKFFHGAKYIFGKDTPFFDIKDPHEIFVAGCCEQVPLDSITSAPFSVACRLLNESGTFYWRKAYSAEKQCFTDITRLDIDLHRAPCPLVECHHCHNFTLYDSQYFEDDKGHKFYDSFNVDGIKYHTGYYALFDNDAWETPAEKLGIRNYNHRDEAYNERLQDCSNFPEMRRKTQHPPHIQRDNLYKIGRIEKISEDRNGEIILNVLKFLRPGDIPNMDFCTIANTPLNELYYTGDFVEVHVKHFRTICDDVYLRKKCLPPPSEVFLDYTNAFFCTKFYDINTNELSDMDSESICPIEGPRPNETLNVLNVFGCGGFASGIASGCFGKLMWGFESDPSIIPTLNKLRSRPQCYEDTFSVEIDKMTKGERVNSSNTVYPVRSNEIGVITASLPGDVLDDFNNTAHELMVLINYLDPKYVVIDAPEEFIGQKDNINLCRVLSALRSLDYHFRFKVLDCAHYGVPQVRKRSIIIAAKKGRILPEMPLPVTYSPSSPEVLTPVRRITVYDAISDLLNIEEGETNGEVLYKTQPQTTFQEWARYGCSGTVTSHTAVAMNPIDKLRVSHLPKYNGSDWRDLPNIETASSTRSPGLHKVEYKRNHSVCTCAGRGTSVVCSGRDKVGYDDTLIPWCLAHTAERNGGWEGAVGRLSNEDMFAHIAGFPVPVGENGRVFHPSQDRFCSVREFARGQGFPDSFMLYGSTEDKQHAVGTETPLLLGQAIGREILKTLQPRPQTKPTENNEIKE